MPKNNKSGKKRSGLGKGLSALMGPSLHDVAENTATEYESGHDAVIDTSASNAVTSNAVTSNAATGNAVIGNATISNATENGKAVTDTAVVKHTGIDDPNEETHISAKEMNVSAAVQNHSIDAKPTSISNEVGTPLADDIGTDISGNEKEELSEKAVDFHRFFPSTDSPRAMV